MVLYFVRILVLCIFILIIVSIQLRKCSLFLVRFLFSRNLLLLFVFLLTILSASLIILVDLLVIIPLKRLLRCFFFLCLRLVIMLYLCFCHLILVFNIYRLMFERLLESVLWSFSSFRIFFWLTNNLIFVWHLFSVFRE